MINILGNIIGATRPQGSSGPPVPAPIGVLSTDNFSTLNGFTSTGTGTQTYNLSGGELVMTGGDGTYTQRLAKTALGRIGFSKWKIKTRIVPKTRGTSAGTVQGTQIGIFNTNPNRAFCLHGQVLFNTDSLGGRLAIITTNNGASPSVKVTSSTNLTIAVNDVVELTLERNDRTVTLTGVNTTTSQTQTITFNFDLASNTTSQMYDEGEFYIQSLRGTQNVQLFETSSDAYRYCKSILLSDSIGSGWNAETGNLGWYQNLKANSGNLHELMAIQGSDSHMVFSRIAQANSLTSEYVIFQIGGNNLANGETVSALMPDYTAAANHCRSAGRKIIHCTNTPRTTLSTAGLRTAILTEPTFSGDQFVDFYTALYSGSGTAPNLAYMNADGVHPNRAGHDVLYNTFTTAFPSF